MFVKPRSAPVGNPSVVASSAGRAKKARYARLLPSTRNSSESRTGPSSSCSSAPVSVLGTGQRYRPGAMRGLEIQPFTDDHLDAAATLLTERHRAHRASEPLLPEAVDFHAEVEGLLAREDASGAVALREGAVVGYLLGARREDEVWGPNIWVEASGHAVEEAEVVRDLYAAVAGHWVEQGRTRHYALVPAADGAVIDAWFRVGFGGQHAHGIQEVPPQTEVTVPEGFEIRGPSAD